MKRTASARWQGNLKNGRGYISTESAALNNIPYSFSTRFEDGGGSNPEELIAAAHAGCMSMALASELEKNGIAAEEVDTQAQAKLEFVDGKWTVTSVNLIANVTAKNIDEEKFQELAQKVKENCIITRLLKANVSLEAHLRSGEQTQYIGFQ